MQKYTKYSLSKHNCDECKKNQNETNADYIYCCKYNKFVCNLCSDKHKNDGYKHNTLNYQRYDALCKSHSNTFYSYCINCKKNICIYCKSEHKSHELIDLSEINFSNEDKNKIEEDINNMETKIANLCLVMQEIINKIENLKKSSELEMKFLKILLLTYKYEENQNNLNFNVIQNLKNFEKEI